MNWHVYCIPPIDFGWKHLKTIQEALSSLATAEYEEQQGEIDSREIREFIDKWEAAKEAAKNKGWEGDFRHEPCVFWLPFDTGFIYGFVFKQDNNGTTFVISPEPLPWLED